jgi:flagellar hook-associated protein 2
MESTKEEYQNKISLLQDLSLKLSTLKISADTLNTSSLYGARTVTSSQENVLTASAQSGAPTGRYTIQVERIALAHQLASGVTSDPSAQVFGTGTITLQVGSGSQVTINITSDNNSLNGIRDAINNAGLPVTASIVGSGSEYHLVILSNATGTEGQITLDVNLQVEEGEGGEEVETLSFSDIQPPQNAKLLLGVAIDASTPLSFEFSSNTVTGLLPGVTLNLLSSSSSSVTVEVKEDTSLLQEQIEKFVENYNDVINTIDNLTFYDPDSGEKGSFLGDVNLSIIQMQLERAVTSVVKSAPEEVNSLSMLGVKLTKTGLLQIEDREALSEKLSTNSAGIKELFTEGVAKNLSQTIQSMTVYGSGTLWVKQDMYQRMIQDIDKRITSLEEIMDLKEERLWRQYTNLETYLSNMQSQSNWLAAQIATLIKQSSSGS